MPRIRESGMPEQGQWEGYFEPAETLRRLGLSEDAELVADLGCGYGSFSIPAAQQIKGQVIALDSDPAMLEIAAQRAAGIDNIRFEQRDFLDDGSGLSDASVDFLMLFNILHLETPAPLLQEARRVLKPDGTVAVIHWLPDPSTPRGPPMDMRPRPEDIMGWAASARLEAEGGAIELPPYHYGLRLRPL